MLSASKGQARSVLSSQRYNVMDQPPVMPVWIMGSDMSKGRLATWHVSVLQAGSTSIVEGEKDAWWLDDRTKRLIEQTMRLSGTLTFTVRAGTPLQLTREQARRDEICAEDHFSLLLCERSFAVPSIRLARLLVKLSIASHESPSRCFFAGSGELERALASAVDRLRP